MRSRSESSSSCTSWLAKSERPHLSLHWRCADAASGGNSPTSPSPKSVSSRARPRQPGTFAIGLSQILEPDVERLRWVLRQQREHFLPLKVIRDRLAAGDLSDLDEPASGEVAHTPSEATHSLGVPQPAGVGRPHRGRTPSHTTSGAGVSRTEAQLAQADNEAMARVVADRHAAPPACPTLPMIGHRCMSSVTRSPQRTRRAHARARRVTRATTRPLPRRRRRQRRRARRHRQRTRTPQWYRVRRPAPPHASTRAARSPLSARRVRRRPPGRGAAKATPSHEAHPRRRWPTWLPEQR